MKQFELIFRIALICSLAPADAQTPAWLWAKGIGGTSDESGKAITLDADGNIYTTGSFSGTVDFDPGAGTLNLFSTGGYDAFILKLTESGSMIWAKGLIGPGYCKGFSITTSPDAAEDIYITGQLNGTVDFDPGPGVFNMSSISTIGTFVVKLDSSGNFKWAKTITGSGDIVSFSIAVDSPGNIYIGGEFWSTGDFDPGPNTYTMTAYPIGTLPDGFVCKLDSAGNFQWAGAFSGTSENIVQSMTVDADGNVYTTGYLAGTVDFDPGADTVQLTSSFGGGSYDCYICKLNTSGNLVWVKKLDGTFDDFGYSVTLDKNGAGAIYVTGNYSDVVDFDPGPSVYSLFAGSTGNYLGFALKLDTAGNFIWANSMEGVYSGNSWDAAVNPINGDFYQTGYFTGTIDFDPGVGVYNLTPTGANDNYISRWDSAGIFIWVKSVDVTDLGHALIVNGSGNCYLTGSFKNISVPFNSSTLTNANSSGTTSDLFIAKLDSVIFTGINNNFSASGISLFPNPVSKYLNVKVSGNENTVLAIYDATGRFILITKLYAGDNKLMIDGLIPGIYIVEVKSGINYFREKVVKL